jgi:hypothetical protein
MKPRTEMIEGSGSMGALIVIAIGVLIQVSEQVEWFDTHVGSAHRPLQQTQKFSSPLA